MQLFYSLITVMFGMESYSNHCWSVVPFLCNEAVVSCAVRESGGTGNFIPQC